MTELDWKVVSVTVGGVADLTDLRGGTLHTGIVKTPARGRVPIATTGLAGDAQGNLKVHGGPDNAVYAYSADHYVAWRAEERRDFAFGQFGENLTVAGLREDAACIGDVFRAGTAVLQVTQPRVPCSTLGAHLRDAKFPDRFLASRRTGFYLRVLAEGEVGAGDAFALAVPAPERITVREAAELLYGGGGPRERLELLGRCAGLSRRWRSQVEKRLTEAAA